MNTKTGTAGVIARPPRIMLGFLLSGAALDVLLPGPTLPAAVRFGAGPALAAGGMVLMAAAMGRFKAVGTPVETCKPTSALATDGPYRYSRNPIYLAGLLLYGGLALMIGPWTFCLALPFALAIRYGVIAREERYLADRFGAAYDAYRRAVPRWLGPPGRPGAEQAAD
jgi:protein-S-isoprenylcysteine O-methyltransferase Ste14